MNYNQTVEFLYNQLPVFHRIGAAAYKANLEKTIALDDLLGHPANSFPSIHIAGTNGKGSVSNLLASVLQTAGYKTGLFTSPHLIDFRERIRVNGVKISKQYVTSFIRDHSAVFETIQPSFFEMTFALATDYFRNEKIDIAVIETGMGGRLDSTNIIHPLLSIITNIGIDHSQFLGNTPEKIAAEKAGIIKAGIPVVIGQYQPEVHPVFENKAKELGSPLFIADQNFYLSNIFISPPRYYLNCTIHKKNGELFNTVSSPLNALYQTKNLLTFAQAVSIISSLGFTISEADFSEGVKMLKVNTEFAGRWQQVSFHPAVYCDIAHNIDGIKELLLQIEQLKYHKLFFVFGMVNDKEHQEVLKLLPKQAEYLFCKPDVPRGMDAKVLYDLAMQAGLHGTVCNSAFEGLQLAKRDADKKDIVIVTGSTFIVAEILRNISRRKSGE